MELLAAVNVFIMVYVSHRHAVRSSSLVALFLLGTLLVDVVKSRSYFLRDGLAPLGGLAVATASLRLCLLILDERSKKEFIIDDDVRAISGPESTSGFFTRSFFLHLSPLFMIGYSSKLRGEDLGSLGLELSSEFLHQKLKRQWDHTKAKTSRFSLLWACFWTWKWDILLILIPRLANMGFGFAQPFLIQRVTETVDMDNLHQGNKILHGERAGMQCACLLIYIGLAVSKAATAQLSNRLAAQVRGGLIAQLMEKTHHLGEKEAKRSAVLTHMSSDIEDIAKGIINFIDIPMSVVETALGVYLLSRFIDAACFFVLFPVIGTNILSVLLGRMTGPANAKWNESIEVRVARTTEILKQLPYIKMLGLGPIVRMVIHQLRIDELDMSRPYRMWMGLVNMTQQFADLGTPAVVVAAAFFWKGFDGNMNASKVFPTLAVVNLIQMPTLRVLLSYSDFTAMVACYGRIQKFLLLPERKDSRTKWEPSASPDLSEPAPAHFGSTIMQNLAPAMSPNGIIQFSNASVRALGMEDPLLSDVNIMLTRGSVSNVFGETGSGKTTFLQSVLGETFTDGGRVYADDVNIAYCGPQVWLKDCSIRDNIIGCLPFDPVRYEVALRVCQLEEDLRTLPGGDSYVVGMNGSNLSGGQRQRVALARAVFARCAITVIDDGFSALDRYTAVSILYELCGPNGVLRKSGSTVLLSTYLPEVSNVIDQVVNIGDNGFVSLEPVHANDSVRQQTITNFFNSVSRPNIREIEEQEKAEIRRLWGGTEDDPENPNRTGNDEDGQKKGNWRLYLIFIDSVGRWNCAGLCLLALLMAASEFVPDIYLRYWTQKEPRNGEWYGGYAGTVGIACVITGVTYWFLFTVAAVNAAVALHEQLLDVSMRASMGFLTSTKTGNLLNRFSQDSNLFSKSLPSLLWRTVYFIFSNIIIIDIILSSATYMSAILPVILLSIYFIQAFYLRTSRQMRYLDLEEKAPLYTYFVETADGLIHIHAFGWQEQNMAQGYKLLDNSQKPYYLMLCIQQWLGLVLGLLTTVVAFTLVSVVVWARSSSSGPAVGLSFLSILNFQRTLTLLLECWTGAETSIAAVARLDSFKRNTPQEPKLPVPPTLPNSWPSVGSFNLGAVNASYRYVLQCYYHSSRVHWLMLNCFSYDSNAPPTLRDLSIFIDGRDKVGVVGRTGSGKSSFLLTLLGLLEFTGTVEIDGIDIHTVDPDLLRSRIITITQEPVRFSTTVRKNLLPFTMGDKDNEGEEDPEQRHQRRIQDNMLQDVLDQLGLWNQVEDHGGLTAMLPDVGFSKGEMQLFSIARAIVRRRQLGPGLVLIDEGTSNLDPGRDALTQQVMQKEFNDCTVVTVAHRQESIQGVDCTLELSGGRLVSIRSPTQQTQSQGTPGKAAASPSVGSPARSSFGSARSSHSVLPREPERVINQEVRRINVLNEGGPSSARSVFEAAERRAAALRSHHIRVDFAICHSVRPPPPPEP